MVLPLAVGFKGAEMIQNEAVQIFDFIDRLLTKLNQYISLKNRPLEEYKLTIQSMITPEPACKDCINGSVDPDEKKKDGFIVGPFNVYSLKISTVKVL